MEEEPRRREGARVQVARHKDQFDQADSADRADLFERPNGAEQAGASTVVGSLPGPAVALPPHETIDHHPTLTRLQSAIDWYDRQSARNLRASKRLKTASLVAAAMIPFFAGLDVPAAIVAGLGVVIVLLEAMQQLHQYQQLGAHYRATAEALKHEQYLFVAGARPYDGDGDVLPLLAERVEALVAQAQPE